MTAAIPAWAAQTPSTAGVHPSGTQDTDLTLPFTQAQLLQIGAQLVEQFLITVVKALTGNFIPGALGAAFTQLEKWATDSLPAEIVTMIETYVKKIINAILAPFGQDDATAEVGDLLTTLEKTLTAPLQGLANIEEFFTGILGKHNSAIADMQAQINVLKQSKVDISTPTGFSDPCIDASGFDTPLIGTLTPTGFGTLTASGLAVAHYIASPGLDRNRVGMLVKIKRLGQTGIHFCSSDSMDSFCRILLNSNGDGKDTVSVITGTGPDTGLVTRTTYTMRLPSEAYWECAYEPYDDDTVNSNTVHVFMGGSEIVPVRWEDQGNVLMHDTDHLRWGVLLNGLNDAQHRGFDITNVTFGNWLTGAPQ